MGEGKDEGEFKTHHWYFRDRGSYNCILPNDNENTYHNPAFWGAEQPKKQRSSGWAGEWESGRKRFNKKMRSSRLRNTKPQGDGFLGSSFWAVLSRVRISSFKYFLKKTKKRDPHALKKRGLRMTTVSLNEILMPSALNGFFRAIFKYLNYSFLCRRQLELRVTTFIAHYCLLINN